jgi:hypothetical protein
MKTVWWNWSVGCFSDNICLGGHLGGRNVPWNSLKPLCEKMVSLRAFVRTSQKDNIPEGWHPRNWPRTLKIWLLRIWRLCQMSIGWQLHVGRLRGMPMIPTLQKQSSLVFKRDQNKMYKVKMHIWQLWEDWSYTIQIVWIFFKPSSLNQLNLTYNWLY